jgi:hypothetical protein
MRIKLSYMTPLLVAAAAAVAIAAAPIATAAPTAASGPSQVQSGPSQVQQSCTNLGGTQTECQSPGNAGVYDAPPQVTFFPYAGGAT